MMTEWEVSKTIELLKVHQFPTPPGPDWVPTVSCTSIGLPNMTESEARTITESLFRQGHPILVRAQ